LITFGSQFREWRVRLDYTQRELAKLTGVSHTYISKIEADATPHPPSDEFLRKAANVLLVPHHVIITQSGRTVPIKISDLEELTDAFKQIALDVHWAHGSEWDARPFRTCGSAHCILHRATLEKMQALNPVFVPDEPQAG